MVDLRLVATRGGDRRSDQTDKLSVSSYSAQAAESLGVDERTVRRDLARGKKIVPEALEIIAGTAEDNPRSRKAKRPGRSRGAQ